MLRPSQFYVLSLGLLLTLFAGSANALVISSTTDPHWFRQVGPGTTFSTAGGTVTMSTAPNASIWFGNALGASPPAFTDFSVGSNSAGNYLSVTARFANNPRDWSDYLIDLDGYEAAFGFASTDCNSNVMSCYGLPALHAVEYFYADGSNNVLSGSIELDLSRDHSFDFLLKDGQVFYRVDGLLVFSGPAYRPVLSYPGLIVIGDGSGGNRTGEGTMIVSSVYYDSGFEADALTDIHSSAPAPAALWLMLSGIAGLGLSRRRKRGISS